MVDGRPPRWHGNSTSTRSQGAARPRRRVSARNGLDCVPSSPRGTVTSRYGRKFRRTMRCSIIGESFRIHRRGVRLPSCHERRCASHHFADWISARAGRQRRVELTPRQRRRRDLEVSGALAGHATHLRFTAYYCRTPRRVWSLSSIRRRRSHRTWFGRRFDQGGVNIDRNRLRVANSRLRSRTRRSVSCVVDGVEPAEE